MASSSSSSPSSSAVTIPRPGKSILKKPAPTPQSFLSRFSKFLPTQTSTVTSDPHNPVNEGQLKRAHFILPQLVTIYPISTANPPCSPSIKEEKKNVELREAERRQRIVRGNSFGPAVEGQDRPTEDWWSMDRVELFYRESCDSREETPNSGISTALKKAGGTSPRSVDLSGIQLSLESAGALSDVFSVEWGLRKLILRECSLDEHIIKPILHALLIPASLSFLSVASNRRLKSPAFRVIGAFLKKARSVQFLDLSQIPLDKKSIEFVVAALAAAGEQGLVSLRLDDCTLRPAALEALAHAVRVSSLRNISLRHNRIQTPGAVALALMIKDYPDTYPTSNLSSAAGAATPSPPSTPTASSLTLSSTNSSTPAPKILPSPSRSGQLPPPPRHPSATVQTTYTPYIPKSRRAAVATVLSPPGSPNPQIPVITSSAQGGITTKHPVPLAHSASAASSATRPGQLPQHHGPSAALLDKVRALDALPRLGELRTLDLRGNDIRGGVTYIAQVLKRNRTLKVLNLSENKIDVQGLVAIAEALKYNSNLETLDLSRNPCSGPSLDGIQSLRTAFTLNTSLKRLFLACTGLTGTGAIALAEFLPESISLLHLDLTDNVVDLAGVMALSGGLKANHVMRCLDLNIPPDDEEFAKMCREILNSCIRNTEGAEGSGRGPGKAVWNMIEDSELAKSIKQAEKKDEPDIVLKARESLALLQECAESSTACTPSNTATADLITRTEILLPTLIDVIRATTDSARMEELLQLNDSLSLLLERVKSSISIAKDSAPRSKGVVIGLGIDVSLSNGGAPNGHQTNGDPAAVSPFKIDDATDSEDQEEDEPETPRIDKGKGRAEPEPEVFEPVLSPSLSRDETKGLFVEEPAEGEEQGSLPTPTDRSKSWVEEEGEVFRKGAVLLGPEEMEGDYDGEELRVGLLEAQVERPPPRPVLVDEYGMDYLGDPVVPKSPVIEGSPITPDESKPAPKPYVRRSRSSSSLQSGSPTIPHSEGRGRDSDPQTPLSPMSPHSPTPYAPRRRSPSSISSDQQQ